MAKESEEKPKNLFHPEGYEKMSPQEYVKACLAFYAAQHQGSDNPQLPMPDNTITTKAGYETNKEAFTAYWNAGGAVGRPEDFANKPSSEKKPWWKRLAVAAGITGTLAGGMLLHRRDPEPEKPAPATKPAATEDGEGPFKIGNQALTVKIPYVSDWRSPVPPDVQGLGENLNPDAPSSAPRAKRSKIVEVLNDKEWNDFVAALGPVEEVKPPKGIGGEANAGIFYDGKGTTYFAESFGGTWRHHTKSRVIRIDGYSLNLRDSNENVKRGPATQTVDWGRYLAEGNFHVLYHPLDNVREEVAIQMGEGPNAVTLLMRVGSDNFAPLFRISCPSISLRIKSVSLGEVGHSASELNELRDAISDSISGLPGDQREKILARFDKEAAEALKKRYAMYPPSDKEDGVPGDGVKDGEIAEGGQDSPHKSPKR